MTKPPDFAALAREYLDLWEDQLAAMGADPALAEQSARFFEAMGTAGAAANPFAAAQMTAMAQQLMTLAGLAPGGKADDGEASNVPAGRRAAGPAPAAAAPDDSAELLAQLASRLAAIEKRLDRLEAGSRGKGRSTKPAAGKSRSGAGAKSSAKRKPAERKRR